MPLSICLDPGHGGYDPGACANGLQEKDLNLFVALHLRDLLEHAGIKVVMTRESDVCPAGNTTNERNDLQARCDISDNAGVDWFLSIHFNAGGGVGSESYVIPGGEAVHLAPSLVNACALTFGNHGEAVKDGGANGANLYVLKHTDAHAILLEVAYVDSSDAQKIKDRMNEVAPNLANVLIKVLGGSVPVDVPTPTPPVVVEPIATPLNVDLSNYVSKDDLVNYVTKEELNVIIAAAITDRFKKMEG